jgi:hypothetical protein
MTGVQTKLFWRLWSRACQTQGWMGDEREVQRKVVLGELGFSSLKDVDSTRGFDRVKARLNILCQRLEGARDETWPDLGEARRHAWIIEHDLIPGLAEHLADAPAYVAQICLDKFGHPTRWQNLMDDPKTGPRKVRDLLFTLTARLQALRREAGVAPKASKMDKPLRNRRILAPDGQTDGQAASPRWDPT